MYLLRNGRGLATAARDRFDAAGALYFAGQAGELVFGSPSDLVDVVFVVLGVGGFVALGVAFRELRRAVTTRAGRIGVRLGLAGRPGSDEPGCCCSSPWSESWCSSRPVTRSVHIGLFVFEGAWVAFGISVLRAGRQPVSAPATHPA